MATAPTPIGTAPSVPVSTDPESTFDSMFEAFLSWLKVTGAPGINASAEVTYNNAVEAAASAVTATAQSQAAVAAVNSVQWAAGVYAAGVCVWSPTNGRTYRAKAAFTSAIDPVLDPSNWWDIASFGQSATAYLSSATTLSLGVNNILTTNGIAYPLPSSPTVGDWVGYRNASGGTTLSLDPGALKVEGTTGPYTLDLPGFMGVLSYTGSTNGWVHVPR